MATSRRNSLAQLRSPAGANTLLGLWLVVSAFAFRQSFDEALVTAIIGVLIAICSAGELVAPDLRYLDALLAFLLGTAALVLPTTNLVAHINEACVAAAVIVVSLLSNGVFRGVSRGVGPREQGSGVSSRFPDAGTPGSGHHANLSSNMQEDEIRGTTPREWTYPQREIPPERAHRHL